VIFFKNRCVLCDKALDFTLKPMCEACTADLKRDRQAANRRAYRARHPEKVAADNLRMRAYLTDPVRREKNRLRSQAWRDARKLTKQEPQGGGENV
jgi:predicted amidophosphoribosyltransferase